MDFSSALKGIKAGFRLRRPDWPEGDSVSIMSNGAALCFSYTDAHVGKTFTWDILHEDILAEDWEIV